jgi:hypothetical protein
MEEIVLIERIGGIERIEWLITFQSGRSYRINIISPIEPIVQSGWVPINSIEQSP